MKIRTQLLLLVVFFALNSNAQSVISASGQSGSSASLQASATLGEVAIGSNFNNTVYGNQGFQQPLQSDLVSTTSFVLESGYVNIYPNPTSHLLYFDLAEYKDNHLKIYMCDLHGHTLRLLSWEGSFLHPKMDISNYPQGIYLLRLVNNQGLTKTQKIVITK